MIARILVLTLAALVLSAPLVAPSPELDRKIEAEMEKRHIPGAMLALVSEGKIVWSKGYGVAEIKKKPVPVTATTRFPIGSMTKSFTATAILLLAEDGKLELDGKLAAYLPALPDSYSEVTIRHLLSHTSGIQRDFKVSGQSLINDALLAKMAETPLDFPPGEKIDYSNTGFILLGMVIESVSGKSYAEFLQERIFTPLAMDRTLFFLPNEKIQDRAVGYEWNGKRYRTVSFLPGRYAAGSLMSTLDDLVRWDAALYGDSPVSEAVRNQMWSRQKLNDGKIASIGRDPWEVSYDTGLGWFLSGDDEIKLIYHGGATDGFSSQFEHFPESKKTVIALANTESGHVIFLARIVAEHEGLLKGD